MSFIYARMVKAKPFQSDSLDRLAKTMNATKILKKGKLKRYYKVLNLIRGCMSYFDAILFDAKYYDNLSSEERLAVGAHEFNHIIQNHDIEKFKRQILPGLVIGTLLALLTFYFDLFSYFITLSQSERILLSASIVPVSCIIFMFASFYLNANWLSQTETQSDLSAVNFANGEALISALTKLNQLRPKKSNRCQIYETRPKTCRDFPIRGRTDKVLSCEAIKGGTQIDQKSEMLIMRQQIADFIDTQGSLNVIVKILIEAHKKLHTFFIDLAPY